MKKTPEESKVIATHLVLPEHTNSLGTIFGGQLMAWMDIAAATCAYRHGRSICVTVWVDHLHFKSPVQLGHIVMMEAKITYVHISSMEIKVTVKSENPLSGEQLETCSAFFTFVAKGESGAAKIKVPQLELTTPEEKQEFKNGHERRAIRLKNAKKN